MTYNVQPDDYGKTPNTIMIHRKKETNTLYTVNALNAIIRKVNNGVLDKSYIIEWENYSNSLLLTDGDDVRHIHLDLYKITKSRETDYEKENVKRTIRKTIQRSSID